jgi:hypothetical protein
VWHYKASTTLTPANQDDKATPVKHCRCSCLHMHTFHCLRVRDGASLLPLYLVQAILLLSEICMILESPRWIMIDDLSLASNRLLLCISSSDLFSTRTQPVFPSPFCSCCLHPHCLHWFRWLQHHLLGRDSPSCISFSSVLLVEHSSCASTEPAIYSPRMSSELWGNPLGGGVTRPIVWIPLVPTLQDILR